MQKRHGMPPPWRARLALTVCVAQANAQHEHTYPHGGVKPRRSNHARGCARTHYVGHGQPTCMCAQPPPGTHTYERCVSSYGRPQPRRACSALTHCAGRRPAERAQQRARTCTHGTAAITRHGIVKYFRRDHAPLAACTYRLLRPSKKQTHTRKHPHTHTHTRTRAPRRTHEP